MKPYTEMTAGEKDRIADEQWSEIIGKIIKLQLDLGRIYSFQAEYHPVKSECPAKESILSTHFIRKLERDVSA